MDVEMETLPHNIFFENVPHFNPLSRLDEPSASVPRCINPLSFRCEAASRRIIVPEPGLHIVGIIFRFLIEPSRGNELQFFAQMRPIYLILLSPNNPLLCRLTRLRHVALDASCFALCNTSRSRTIVVLAGA